MSTSDHCIDLSVFLNDLCEGYLTACGMYMNSVFYYFLLFDRLFTEIDFYFTEGLSFVSISSYGKSERTVFGFSIPDFTSYF